MVNIRRAISDIMLQIADAKTAAGFDAVVLLIVIKLSVVICL